MTRASVIEVRGAAAGSRDAAVGSSCDRTNAVAAKAAKNTSEDVFMERCGDRNVLLVDGKLEESCQGARNVGAASRPFGRFGGNVSEYF